MAKLMELPIIQSLWIGKKLSRMERLSIVSFQDNYNNFHLYTYEDVENVPEGVILKDANSIIPQNKIFKYKENGSYAGFADLFRYKLLLEKGGYWVDLDIASLKPYLTDRDYVFASERKRFVGVQINNCLIGAPVGSEIMEFCYTTAVSMNPEELKWGDIGPKLLTEAVIKFDLLKLVTNTTIFSPVNWWEVADFTSKSLSEIIPEQAYAVHFYNQAWKNRKIDNEVIYDHKCAYEELFAMYPGA